MGKIKVTECGGIKGLKVVEPTVFGDARGYFMETYNYNDFKEAGIDVEFVQDNQSSSHIRVYFADFISRSITHRINWYVL